MKRYLAIGAVVVVLIAAAWGGGWWLGRDEVARSLDEGIAELERQGWTVAWEDRQIGGFPFSYTVRLTDLTATAGDGSVVLRLPWALAETEGVDRLAIRTADTFALQIAASDGTGDAALPAIDAAGETDALVLRLATGGAIEATADRLAWTVEQPELGSRVTQAFENMVATNTPEPPGARYRLQASRMDAEIEQAEAGGPTTAVIGLRDVMVEGLSTLGTPEALAEMIYAGAPGQAMGSLRTGPAEVRMAVPGDAAGSVDWRADATSGTATLSSGRMELEGETRGNVWTVASSGPAVPLDGQLSVELASAAYAMPMAPSAMPDEMAVRLALQEVAADEAAWASIDAAGALPHDPASLLVDIVGTVRVTERIDTLRPGAPPPFELSSIAVRDVSLEALGASAHATGQIDVLQPLGIPLGAVQIGMTGLEALVRGLGRAGVLTPDMVTTAEAIMAVYLRPAEGEDVWTAEISFTREGTLVNGLPVQ